MGENITISKEIRILLCVIGGCIVAAFMRNVFYVQDLGLYKLLFFVILLQSIYYYFAWNRKRKK